MPVPATPADTNDLMASLSVLSRSLSTSEHPTVLGVGAGLRELLLTVAQDREPFDVALRGTVRDTARASRTRTHLSAPHNPLYIEPKDLPNG